MTLDEKKEKLMRYLITMGKLQSKCQQSAEWSELAVSTGDGIISLSKSTRCNTQSYFVVTAINLKQEAEELAAQVNTLRRELDLALEQMPVATHRDLLEKKYIQGKSNRELQDITGYHKKYIGRLIAKAINELEEHSDYFS